MRKSAQTVIRPDAYYTIAAANGRVLEVADFNTENGEIGRASCRERVCQYV